MSRLRLNRFLALAGVASRRRCDEIIQAGRVEVDGVRVSEPGIKVDGRHQSVLLDGKPIAVVVSRTYLLNKPRGVLSAAKDARGGRTVLDVAREAGIEERLFPVGRLDKDSYGLILLSNDGDLSYRLTHPRYGVGKRYQVRINLPITKTQMSHFAAGIELSDGKTRPSRIKPLRRRASYEVILHEGRKRQIRRMFESLNRRVIELRRVGMGSLSLGGLAEGEIRPLTKQELSRLKSDVGLR